jgi:hypothetical protein
MQPLPETKILIAEVISVVPEWHLAMCRTQDKWQYSITRHNEGLQWTDVKVGDMIEIEVMCHLAKVVKAKLC